MCLVKSISRVLGVYNSNLDLNQTYVKFVSLRIHFSLVRSKNLLTLSETFE